MRTGARPRVFLDSNVLFSGLHSPNGAPGLILRRFAEGKVAVVVSQLVLEEVVRTIKAKLPEALPALHRFLLNAPLEVVENPSSEETAKWAQMTNAEDAPILAAAVAAQVDYLVTGDQHFFDDTRIARELGLRIVKPVESLDCL
jgi:putative PIN family toxin of toxin-antitoxin system